MTTGIRANPDLTPMSHKALRQQGVGRGPHMWKKRHRIGLGECHEEEFNIRYV